MQSISRIVTPVDFSERSTGAARCAGFLAAHFGAELVLLHVLPPPPYDLGPLDAGGSMLAELYRNQAERAARDLETFDIGRLAGVVGRRVTVEGDPAEKIVEFAQAEQAGLIVMATHGFGPFRRFILGSNTAKVLHDADCPVWTGVHMEKMSTEEPIALRQVLCAVDLGPQSSKTLCWAALLARRFDARLTLMHGLACGAADSGDVSQREWQRTIRKAAETELTRLQEFVHTDSELLIESGEPAQAICAAALRLAADVLVIGRGSAAGSFGRLRTNAYAIIRQSPCPVVSV
jgi:nucleotide-binding universal stress UspA family protein